MVWNSQGGVPRGTQLNGIYEIESLIAQGGMGEVYTGRAIQTGDRVAIKMILPEHANNPTIVDLFRREASTLHNLYNEAIVRYYVFSVDPALGRPYLAMEYVDGPSLKDLARKGPVSVADIDVLRRRLSLGLHAAHQLGVIHRDISPDNVILPGGSVHKAKIIDFGIAKSSAAGEGTLIGSGMAGKLNYVSPEQLGLYGGEVTGKSDMYSLGLVLAAAAIGEPINMGGSQVEVVEKRRALPDLSRVPSEIRPLIEAMTQPDPAKRPATLEDVANFDLSKLPARRGGKGGGGKKGGGGLVALFAIVALLGGAGGVLYYVGALDKIIGGGDVTPTPSPTLAPFPTPDPNAPTPTIEPTRAPLPTPDPSSGAPLPPSPEVTAANARVQRSYRWISDAFRHERPDLLVLDIEGSLPPGLRFEDTGTGQAVLYGVPTQAGSFRLSILAQDPEGRQGRLEVTIEIDPAETPAPTLAPPTPEPSPEPTPTTGPTTEPTPIVAVPTPVQEPTPTSIFQRPPTATPVEPTPLPPTDMPPTPVPPTAIPTAEPTPFPTPLPTPVPPTPVPPTDVPPTPAPPTPAPPTPAPPTPVPPTSVPDPSNLAPQVLDQVRATIPLSAGAPTNIRIGSFADPEDGTTLDIQLEGELPPGLLLNRAAEAVVAVYGTPTTSGTYSFQITAVDSGGARVSIPVTINVTGGAAPDPTPATADPTPVTTGPTPVPVEPTPYQAPRPGQAVLDYVARYEGGDCFIAAPLDVTDSSAQIAVYAGAPDPIFAFNDAFIADVGFEAQIVAALLSPQQCALARALTPAGRTALASSLRIILLKEELASGEVVSGRMENSNGSVRLFIFEANGTVTELTSLLQGGTLFSFQFAGAGTQVVAAVLPKPGQSLPPGGSLLDLMTEVNAGRADLALTYFNVN